MRMLAKGSWSCWAARCSHLPRWFRADGAFSCSTANSPFFLVRSKLNSTHLFARALSQKILNASNVCTRRVRQTYKNPLDLIGKAREKRMLKRLVSPGICSRRLGTTKPATREGEGLNGFLTPFFAKALRLRRRTSRVRVNTST